MNLHEFSSLAFFFFWRGTRRRLIVVALETVFVEKQTFPEPCVMRVKNVFKPLLGGLRWIN